MRWPVTLETLGNTLGLTIQLIRYDTNYTIRNNLLWTRPIRTRLKFTGGNKPSILSNAG